MLYEISDHKIRARITAKTWHGQQTAQRPQLRSTATRGAAAARAALAAARRTGACS